MERYRREMAFEEEAVFYEKEARKILAKQRSDSDDSEIVAIARHGMRVIAKARKVISEMEKTTQRSTSVTDYDLKLKEGHAVCFDFDGVIHKYSKGWQNGEIYDVSNPEMFSLMRILTLSGIPCFICSTRNPEQILEWWVYNGFSLSACIIDESTKFWNDTTKIGITNRKLPAQVYIDDRAYNYHGQTVKEFLLDFAEVETVTPLPPKEGE